MPHKIVWRDNIQAITKDKLVIAGSETFGIKGKRKALDMALNLFSVTALKPWRVVIQPCKYEVA